MIIDFKKLEEVQNKYSSGLSMDTLAMLINIVLSYEKGFAETPNLSYATSLETLASLGIIKKLPDKKEVQQLNS